MFHIRSTSARVRESLAIGFGILLLQRTALARNEYNLKGFINLYQNPDSGLGTFRVLQTRSRGGSTKVSSRGTVKDCSLLGHAPPALPAGCRAYLPSHIVASISTLQGGDLWGLGFLLLHRILASGSPQNGGAEWRHQCEPALRTCCMSRQSGRAA